MKLAFYPGCSLEGMANDYAHSIIAVFKHLDIELVEIEDWSCCGATAAHSLSETMAVALPARNIAAAEKMGLDIISPCANCFNRLRFSQVMMQKKIYDVPWPVTGNIAIHDMTRFLAQPEMLERIKSRVRRSLKGLKIVSYYGCQMVRPPRITGYHRLRKSDDARRSGSGCRCRRAGLVLQNHLLRCQHRHRTPGYSGISYPTVG